MITKQRANYHSHFPSAFPASALASTIHSPLAARGILGKPKSGMSLLCSEPSMAPTSCREKAKVLTTTHKAQVFCPPTPSLPSPPPSFLPSLCSNHIRVLPAAPHLRTFARAIPTAWKAHPPMEPSSTPTDYCPDVMGLVRLSLTYLFKSLACPISFSGFVSFCSTDYFK